MAPLRWRPATGPHRDLAGVGASLVLALALYPLMMVPALGGRVTGGHAVALLGTFLGICAAQLFRRRAPAAALAVGVVAVLADAVLGPSLPVWFVVADLIYAAARYGGPVLSDRMVPIASVVAALLVTLSIATARTWQDGLTTAVGAVPLALVPVAWGRNVRHHQEIAEAERRSASQVARIAELDRDVAVQDERGRIARDLHDVVAGHVSTIALQAEAAMTSAVAADPEARAVLHGMRSESVRALREMRAMVEVLATRDGGVTDDSAPGTLADLPLLVASARASGLVIEMHSEPRARELSGAIELAAYRIAQEALVNAAKHAPRCRATLTVGGDGPGVAIDLCNDTPTVPDGPRDPATTGGRGLMTMRERAAAVGGSVVAGPDGTTWRVHAELPPTPR